MPEARWVGERAGGGLGIPPRSGHLDGEGIGGWRVRLAAWVCLPRICMVYLSGQEQKAEAYLPRGPGEWAACPGC